MCHKSRRSSAATLVLLAVALLLPGAFSRSHTAIHHAAGAADAPAVPRMRSLLLSPPRCTELQSCGSDCSNCSVTIQAANGEPICTNRRSTFVCSVQCNAGFKLKTVAGRLSCSRPAGLKPPDNFLKPSRNATQRNYRRLMSVGDRIKNMVAASPETVARVACGQSMDTPECFEKLLMGVLPAAYSSNNTNDTGGYTHISLAQDQLGCGSCVGFAATAAIEAAINIHELQLNNNCCSPVVQQSKLNVSEADVSFCKILPPIDCNSSTAYQELLDAVAAGRFARIASRDCHPYHGTNQGSCNAAKACTSQVPAGGIISMAHNGKALGSLAMLKQKIILHGGVITAMAKLPSFESYPGNPPNILYDDEVPAKKELELHAVFCYGFADSTTEPGAGYWLCKNSWGSSWGMNGTFRIAYGAAFIMPTDYTYAIQFGPPQSAKVKYVHQLLRYSISFTSQPDKFTYNCVKLELVKSMHLVRLHEVLMLLVSSQDGSEPTNTFKAQVMSDLISSNLRFVDDLAAENKTFRVCGTARRLVDAGVAGRAFDPKLETLLRIKGYLDPSDVMREWSRASGVNNGFCKWRQIRCVNGSVEEIRINAGTGVEGLLGGLPPAALLQGLSKLKRINISDQDWFWPDTISTLPADWSQLQQLQEINLVNNSASGQIPASWGSLTNLSVLSLAGNRLTGSIPESFGALAKLAVLSLTWNALSGTIPQFLGNLQQLKVLELGNNRVSGFIPENLGTLAELETLDVSINALTGTIPASLTSLRKLRQLLVRQNHLQGSIPSSIGDLTSLTRLEFSFNNLTGTMPGSLGSLTSLLDLSMYSNQLSGRIPERLSSLSTLQVLSLGGNRLTGPVPASLGALVSLQEMRLEHNLLTGTLPASLGKLTDLSFLMLQINRLRGPLPDSYRALTTLTTLAFAYNSLTGSVPPSWSKMAQLKEVYLRNNPGLTGCLPTSWQPQLIEFDVAYDASDIYNGTSITGFCAS